MEQKSLKFGSIVHKAVNKMRYPDEDFDNYLQFEYEPEVFTDKDSWLPTRAQQTRLRGIANRAT